MSVIDFVITWVDPGDPLWRDEKNKYLYVYGLDTETRVPVDAREERYRSWENLRYWFRAAEMYAPWVNKIHFVTYGHLPQWLNTEHPKLHIVRHEDYIPEEYLPVFSSHPIELCMHKIPGLAEQFVYFNDDVFLTAPTRPEDFFVHGLPCDSLSETAAISEKEDRIWHQICQNNSEFLNRHFDRKTCKKQQLDKWFSVKSLKDTLKNIRYSFTLWDQFHALSSHHITQAYLKSTFERVWEMEEDLLSQTCSHRFRSSSDVNHFIFREYQLLSGQFHVYDMYRMGHVYHAQEADKAAAAVRSRKYKVICINDDGSRIDFLSAKETINGAFASMLPEKSAYEK